MPSREDYVQDKKLAIRNFRKTLATLARGATVDGERGNDGQTDNRWLLTMVQIIRF